ncbi:MAG: rhodanese-like domain-containing protein [Clostridia bacterium]|nr:rhodanese-like domain-containing protein [Clostridia bacterium]
MKKSIILVLCLSVFFCLMACQQADTHQEKEAVYMNINAQQAKEIMDTQENYVILDVRTQEEFDEKHIPGAVLIPDYEITNKAEEILKDKDQLILVYCRSGRRSKLASEELLKLGYTNIKEFGGIIDWPYETE